MSDPLVNLIKSYATGTSTVGKKKHHTSFCVIVYIKLIEKKLKRVRTVMTQKSGAAGAQVDGVLI